VSNYNAEQMREKSPHVAAAVDEITDLVKQRDRRLDDLERQANDNSEALANMTFGGGGGRGVNSERLDQFNALLQNLHGKDAPRLTSSQLAEHEAAYASYLRHGQSALDKTDIRNALSVGSDPSGGYTVLPQTDPVPRERLFRTSPMRAVAAQQTITRGGSFEFISDTGEFGSGWVDEDETRSETAETSLAFHTINANEVYALVPITQRLLDDSAIDLGAYVERKLMGKFQRAENSAFVSGDGVKKPRGFLDYTISTNDDTSRTWGEIEYIPSGASGGFPSVSGSTADDPAALYDCKAALHSELRAGAVWAMNSTTLAAVEKLRDANGNPLVRTTLDEATPERLLGFPVVIMEDMPDPAANSLSICFANFEEAYQIVDKPNVRVLRDPFTTKGRTKIYAYKRVGGAVANFDAVKLLRFSVS